MNTQPKNKILVIIICILLIANLTILYFLFNKEDHKKSQRSGRKENITSFLKKEVGFNERQLALFDSLAKENRAEVRTIFDEMASTRESAFKHLARQSFSDSAIKFTASELSNRQKKVEERMLQHLKIIRNICTPGQLPVFDSGFYKIIGRKGDVNSGKKIKKQK